MREKLKYFILNNAYDFGRGIYENMEVSDNTLCFSSERLSGIDSELQGRTACRGNLPL